MIRKARFIRDLNDRDVGNRELVTSEVNPRLSYVIAKGAVVVATERSRYMDRMDIHQLRNVSERQRFGKMSMNDISYLIEPLWLTG
jgi:hypothetical protein